MQLEPFRWNNSPGIAQDYVERFERVRDLYEYEPGAESALAERADWLDGQGKPEGHRDRLSEVLGAFNRKLGASAETLDNIERLRSPRALAVVGGQQAGLFTGPLLVIYKAITIVQEAKAAEEKLERPVVPVFWIAGEDHDWDEVNHVYWLSSKPDVEKLKLEAPSDRRTSVSRMTLNGWEAALAGLDEALMQTEFKAGLMDRLRGFAAESASLTELFGLIMAWLFGSTGLVLLDSDDPQLRRLESSMFGSLLDLQEPLSRALLEGKASLESLGYTPQAEVTADNANLFLFDGKGERTLLVRRDGAFSDKKGENRYSPEQLRDWAESAPDRLSNNVMTRPLMQEFLLPVLGTVLGPGEIAYWSLLRPAFLTMGMRMPLLIPRRGYTLMEGTIRKHMDKFGLSLPDVLERFEERRAAWLKEQDTLGLEERFAKVKEEFRQLYEPVLDTIGGINPGMKKLGDQNLSKILEQIAFLEARSTEANQAQFDAGLRQLERIRLSLYPLNRPQERVYNIFAYLNKYGESWLQELIGQPPARGTEHMIVHF